MAGLLDSDWVKFLAAPRQYYADKRQQQDTEQFQGLLGSLQQQGPVNPADPNGLLMNRAPDQQFWLQAARLPTYQGIAGQQLGIESQGQQAMQRQTQGQDWSTQNMTMAQSQQQELERQKAMATYQIQQQDLQRKWAGTNASIGASNASAGSSNASRDLSAARLTQQQHVNGLLTAPVFAKLPPQQQVEGAEKLANMDRSVASANDVSDWARNRAAGAALPTFAGSSEAKTMQQEWQLSMKPMVMKMINTGVLNGPEFEEVQNLMGKPDDYVLTQSQLNTIANMAQKAEDVRQDTYKAYGLKAPAIGKGQSAAARTLSGGKPVGKVTPVTAFPPDETGQMRPVQRR